MQAERQTNEPAQCMDAQCKQAAVWNRGCHLFCQEHAQAFAAHCEVCQSVCSFTGHPDASSFNKTRAHPVIEPCCNVCALRCDDCDFVLCARCDAPHQCDKCGAQSCTSCLSMGDSLCDCSDNDDDCDPDGKTEERKDEDEDEEQEQELETKVDGAATTCELDQPKSQSSRPSFFAAVMKWARSQFTSDPSSPCIPMVSKGNKQAGLDKERCGFF